MARTARQVIENLCKPILHLSLVAGHDVDRDSDDVGVFGNVPQESTSNERIEPPMKPLPELQERAPLRPQNLGKQPIHRERPNGPRLSCGALKKDSFLNLRAPPASSAC